MTARPQSRSRDMRLWIFLGALNGFVAVTAGAVGAHVLESRLSGPGLRFFDMAAHFQLWHALALMAVGLMSPYPRGLRGLRLLRGAGAGFSVGILLFCGPLYDLAIRGPGGLHWIIPIGGMCLIGGWLALAASACFIDIPPAPGD